MTRPLSFVCGMRYCLHCCALLTLLGLLTLSPLQGAEVREPDEVITLWDGMPPGPIQGQEEERDLTKPSDRLIAGRRIIKLGHVSQPEIHIYRPEKPLKKSPAVVICPGGGYSILAWDLEGTEVADWLNQQGITAVVLKYRVPTRGQQPDWLASVQDAQRALSLTRAHADDWDLDKKRIGILGFSAGGKTAAMTSLLTERQYPARDDHDHKSCRPNATILIYPAYLANEERTALTNEVQVTPETPPMFLVHACDDPVPVEGSLLLTAALKKKHIPAELHVYESGGHGYGLRPVADQPVTLWPERCADWLEKLGWKS